MKQISVKQALQYVADHPEPSSDAPIEMPVWELASRALFEIANTPDARVRGSMSRASYAQRMILNRLVGTRPAGTHPATQQTEEVEFVDLTVGVIRA